MKKSYTSSFEIGEKVKVTLQDTVIIGWVRAIIFTSSKVRYTIQLEAQIDDPRRLTSLHNIDSYYVEYYDGSINDTIRKTEDNYS